MTAEQLELVESVTKRTTQAFADRKKELEDGITADTKSIEANRNSIDQYNNQITTLNANSQAQEQLTQEQEQYLQLIKQLSASITQLRTQQVSANETTQRTTDTQTNATTATQNHTKATQRNTSAIGKAVKQVFTYGSALQILRRAYSTIISTISDMDKALTGMAVVTTMTRQEAWQMAGTLQDLAMQTGLTATEVANAATMFYQQGKSTTQVLELTEAAAKAAAIAGIDLTTSVDLLTNAMNGFQMASSQAMEVSDKFAALAAAAATDYEELAVALSKVAAQANLAGMSMDFTLGMLTAGIETTREAPETIGTALKTIIARMRELTDYGKTLEDGMDLNRVAAALDEIGVAMTDETGMMRDLELVITEVGQKWDTLNTNQQANVAVAMAGTRQQSRFIAMMQDFERTQELVNLSANSYGATLAQSSKYMEGMEAAMNNLTTSFQSLITALTESDVIITIVNVVGQILQGITSVVNNLNLFIPILVLIAGYAVTTLMNKTQEWIIQQQLNKAAQDKNIADKKAQLEHLKNNKQLIKLNAKAAVQDKKEIVAEKEKNKLEIEKQKNKRKTQLIDEGKTAAEAEAIANSEFANDLVKAEMEIKEAELDVILEQNNARLTEQQIDAQIAQQQLELQNEQIKRAGLLGAAFSAIAAPLQIITTLLTAIKAIQAVIVTLTNKEARARIKNMALAAKQKIQDAALAAIAAVRAAFNVHFMLGVAVLAGVAALLVGIGLTIAAASGAFEDKGSRQEQSVRKTTEALKDMQVEVYNLQTSANTVKGLANEFDELSNKVIKSAEDVARLNEIVQQVNDEAGFDVITENADPQTQQEQLRNYATVTQMQADAKINEMSDTLTEGYQDYIGKNGEESAENVQAFINDMREHDAETFNATMRTLGQANIEGIDSASNAEVQNAILNMAAKNAEDIIQEDGTLDWTNFNKEINEDFIQGLNDVYTSGSMADYSEFYRELSDYQKDVLSETMPIFETFEKMSDNAMKALDDMDLSVQDLNDVFSTLMGTEEENIEAFNKMAEEVGNIQFDDSMSEAEQSAERRRLMFEKAIEYNRQTSAAYIELSKMSQQQLEEQAAMGNTIAQQYLDAKNNIDDLEKKAQEEADKLTELQNEEVKDKKKDEQQKKIEEQAEAASAAAAAYNEANDVINKVENSEEDLKESTLAAMDALLEMSDTASLVDSITSLSSTMERLSKISDLSSMSFEEQAELLKDYPELIGAMEKGYLTSAEAMKIYQKQYDDLLFNAENRMKDIEDGMVKGLELNKYTVDGFNLANLFATDGQYAEQAAAMRQKIVSMTSEEFQD